MLLADMRAFGAILISRRRMMMKNHVNRSKVQTVSLIFMFICKNCILISLKYTQFSRTDNNFV